MKVRSAAGPLALSLALSLSAADAGAAIVRTSHATRADDTVSAADATRDARPMRFGALAAIGVPRPLAVEGFVVVHRAVALGLEYSVLPKITVAGVDATAWALSGDVRSFPFRGPFFVGARLGHQTVSASTIASYGGYSQPVAMDVGSWFVNPRIGFLWTWAPGIAIGANAGIQIPVTSDSTITPDSPQVASTTEARTIARWAGATVLPTIDLLQIGAVF